MFPLVEQSLERGMHLLDGLVLEEGHRVLPFLIRTVDDLDAHLSFHGRTARQLESLLLLEHLGHILVHLLRPDQHVVGVDLYVSTSVGHAVSCALGEYRGGLPSDVPPCCLGARPYRAEGGVR